MDRTKLTLKQFYTFKQQCHNMLKEYDKYIDENINNPDFNEDESEKEFINKYYQILNQLLSYDLSEIPFEAWEDFEIIDNYGNVIDFSGIIGN